MDLVIKPALWISTFYQNFSLDSWESNGHREVMGSSIALYLNSEASSESIASYFLFHHWRQDRRWKQSVLYVGQGRGGVKIFFHTKSRFSRYSMKFVERLQSKGVDVSKVTMVSSVLERRRRCSDKPRYGYFVTSTPRPPWQAFRDLVIAGRRPS